MKRLGSGRETAAYAVKVAPIQYDPHRALHTGVYTLLKNSLIGYNST
jgi:hypothetical protein